MNEQRRSRGGGRIFSTAKRVLFLLLVVALAVVIVFATRYKTKIKAEYARKEAEVLALESEIDEEDKKLAELKKNSKQAVTNEELESIARQELGLVKRNEIIIKPNE